MGADGFVLNLIPPAALKVGFDLKYFLLENSQKNSMPGSRKVNFIKPILRVSHPAYINHEKQKTSERLMPLGYAKVLIPEIE
jgi:hypothetical protein